MPELKELPLSGPDQIMAANSRFAQLRDEGRTDLINAAVGVVVGEDGHTWRPVAVRAGLGAALEDHDASHDFGYQPPRGNEKYLDETVLFATGNSIDPKTTIGVQTLGGTDAVSTARSLLETVMITSDIVDFPEIIIDEGWPNYNAIFKDWSIEKGARIVDAKTHEYNHEAYMLSLYEAAPHTVLLLQSSGYNGDGIDRTREQWDEIIATLAERNMVAIIDSAYRGLSEGEGMPDMYALNQCIDKKVIVFLANSQSKNMGLYDHRLGAMIGFNYPEKLRAATQQALNNEIRRTRSNSPKLAATAAAMVLGKLDWRLDFIHEMRNMKNILQLRRMMFANVLGADFEWVKNGNGLFTTLLPKGFRPDQVQSLEDQGIVALPGARLNFGGIPSSQIDRVAGAIAAVL